MIPSIGITEMVVIGVVAILLFGSRLPLVARNIGRSYGELRRGLTDLKTTIDDEIDEAEKGMNGPRNTGTPDAAAVDDFDEPTAPRLNPPANDS